MSRTLESLFDLGRRALNAWWNDEAPRLSAALAFYAILSLAPMVVLLPQIIDRLVAQTVSQATIVAEVSNLIGPLGGEAVREMIESARRPTGGMFASMVSIITLLFGASAVFTELRSAMNKIWDVPAKETDGGLKSLIRERFFSFAMVLAVGFLLLVSLITSAVFSTLSRVVVGTVPGSRAIWGGIDFVISFAGTSILFALIFKFLPERKVEWREVRFGAIATAFLFTVGKLLIGSYIGNAGVGEAYGGGGSMIVVLVWVYYSSMLFFLGAEITSVFARERSDS